MPDKPTDTAGAYGCQYENDRVVERSAPLILRLLDTTHLIHFHIILGHLSAHIGIELFRILLVLFAADFLQKVLLEHPQGIFAVAADFAVASILRDFVGKQLRRAMNAQFFKVRKSPKDTVRTAYCSVTFSF